MHATTRKFLHIAKPLFLWVNDGRMTIVLILGPLPWSSLPTGNE